MRYTLIQLHTNVQIYEIVKRFLYKNLFISTDVEIIILFKFTLHLLNHVNVGRKLKLDKKLVKNLPRFTQPMATCSKLYLTKLLL